MKLAKSFDGLDDRIMESIETILETANSFEDDYKVH